MAGAWQPMSSAPIDGRYVLIFCDGIYQARYDSVEDLWYFPVDGCAVDPTHWMPLPDPPANEDDGVHTGDDERLDLLISIRSAIEQLREGEEPIDIDAVLDDCAALDALLLKTIQRESGRGEDQ